MKNPAGRSEGFKTLLDMILISRRKLKPILKTAVKMAIKTEKPYRRRKRDIQKSVLNAVSRQIVMMNF